MTAREAREGLAQGLQLLQTPGLPQEFLHAAEPIARAMGALMQAERGDGRAGSIRPNAETALLAVREALGRLQVIPSGHPAAEQAMSAVATSLGKVHQLSRFEDAAAQPQWQQPPAAPQYAAPPAAPAFAPAPPAYAQQPAQQPQWQPPAAAQPAPQYAQPAPQYAQPAAPQYAQPAAPPQYTQPSPQPAQHAAFAPTEALQRPPSLVPVGPESLLPPSGVIEAELGAHSHSNFYKTLSGNDIVEHGGIFVSTYANPTIGSRVQLRVHLPGGYHFDCAGIVRWTRDERDNADAPPGFGAQFQGMAPEMRQLIQRYVRNREPLFYDDL